jgi:hypothetical protein
MLIFLLGAPILGSDHGIKAQGDGWLLTVALIEGCDLPSVDSGGFSDPYVVFTCNGKVRTSSIKFQKSNPLWNGEYHAFIYYFLSYNLNKLNPYLIK